MGALGDLVNAGRTLCVMGFDDAPFSREAGSPVSISGVVCHGTRFEGMVWGQATQDGTDATSTLSRMLTGSKFASQVHVVLTDGVTVGGLNVIDLASLHAAVGCPCIAVMRKPPDRDAMRRALQRVPESARRWDQVLQAGPVHQARGFTYQVRGAGLDDAARALEVLTDRGKVPEALRLAHLIGGAVVTGTSSKRA